MRRNTLYLILLIFGFVVNTQLLSSSNQQKIEDRDPQKISGGFGGGSICFRLYNFIRRILPQGSTLLEFGSGWTSSEFSKYYTVYSVEHSKEWIGVYNTNYIYAPIVDKWYDTKILKKELPEHYDLILIDGPPGHYPSDPGRYGFFRNLDLFNVNVPIIIDDTNRPKELKLLKDLASYLSRSYQIYPCGHKAFGYIPC